jgi:hypothetical protein
MTEFDLHTKVDLENGSPAFAKPVLGAVLLTNLKKDETNKNVV